jgi:hypothetical protein
MSQSAMEVAREVRVELRSILRQFEDLRRPITRFHKVENRPVGRPQFHVEFDAGPLTDFIGLHLGELLSLGLPDERIHDAAYELAKSIWQLKDRLRKWVVAANRPETEEEVEDYAARSTEMLVVADLANWKKHGELGKYRCGDRPRIDIIEFNLSNSGKVECYSHGGSKQRALFVERNAPIGFTIPIVFDRPDPLTLDGMQVFSAAIDHWKPFIHQVQVLQLNDGESIYLRDLLVPPGIHGERKST